ncbi:exodeoxyribonuclease VII small subunit [bacterium]|nr:exodeoxyribonuclease VII small subunit [bacterium]
MIDQDIKKLDEIAKKIEGGDLPLEDTLKLFQDGVELVRKCGKTLDEAELKVKEILEKSGGEFSKNDVDV